MKAAILAGGRGTRGRPYTDYFPKAMTPVDGRPAIGYIADYLLRSGAGEIIVIADLAGLGGQIRDYLGGTAGVSFVQDSGAGTAGDLLHAAGALSGESEFVLWFADNLCAADVGAMAEQMRKKGSLACVATRSRRREETGFAEVSDGIVTRFVEKPEVRLPLAECLGVYVLDSRILGRIRGGDNLSFDVLAPLSAEGRISALDIGGADWIDIESPAILERNAAVVSRIKRQMGF